MLLAMERREFLIRSGTLSLMGAMGGLSVAGCGSQNAALPADEPAPAPAGGAGQVTLFLAGDVMTGRGLDQVMPHSVDPRLYEPYVRDAREYVALAERANGPIPRGVAPGYVWGDALDELARTAPDARIVNLETAVTTSDGPWRDKAIHYRMHPANVPVVTAAGIDVCVLANNHVLDWGRGGLRETLDVLQGAGVRTVGAGRDLDEAAAPAEVETAHGRLLVFAYGLPDAGVPADWAATARRPGVHWLAEPDADAAGRVRAHVRAHRRAGDRVVVSLHWGGNWGYQVPGAQRRFAHALVDAGAADVVHGHSSHHPKGIEVHRDRLILYGCGDLLNDYEGISGEEAYRAELTLLYFPVLDASGRLARLEMAPMRVRRFRLERASDEEARWLAATLDRESARLGAAGVELAPTGRLRFVRW